MVGELVIDLDNIKMAPDWEIDKELAFAEGFARGRESQLSHDEVVWLTSLRKEKRKRESS